MVKKTPFKTAQLIKMQDVLQDLDVHFQMNKQQKWSKQRVKSAEKKQKKKQEQLMAQTMPPYLPNMVVYLPFGNIVYSCKWNRHAGIYW